MIKVVEQEPGMSVEPVNDPICPFCETTIETIYTREIRSYLGRRYLYYCSQCKKVLGISHRKGFWMG